MNEKISIKDQVNYDDIFKGAKEITLEALKTKIGNRDRRLICEKINVNTMHMYPHLCIRNKAEVQRGCAPQWTVVLVGRYKDDKNVVYKVVETGLHWDLNYIRNQFTWSFQTIR